MENCQCVPFFDPRTSTLTYVVSDPATRDAVIIDPVLDYCPLASQTSTESIDAVLAHLQKHDLHLRYVLETHAHADHLSAGQLLRQRLQVPIAIGARITAVQQAFKDLLGLPADFAVDGRQFDRLLQDGETLAAGSLRVQVLATPGHTPACVSYLIAGAAAAPRLSIAGAAAAPRLSIGDALFCGDALFIEDYGTGRCDFPGGDAAVLYRSIHERIYELPAETRVFPGHDYQPGGRPLRSQTTVAAQRASNIHLRHDTLAEDFVRFRRARDATLTPPRLLFPSIQVNIDAGRLPREEAAGGHRYLRIPLNVARPTDDAGAPR